MEKPVCSQIFSISVACEIVIKLSGIKSVKASAKNYFFMISELRLHNLFYKIHILFQISRNGFMH